MQNPTVSGTTLPFDIAIYKNGTNIIYNQKLNIPGVPITPGPITNIALNPVISTSIQSTGKKMDYVLTFLPKNIISTGSMITLEFPTTFQIDMTTVSSYYIISGLDDVEPANPVGMSIISNIITLSYYATYSNPQQINLYLRMNNPLNSGPTTPVKIRTWTNYLQAIKIDEDIVTAVTSISTISILYINLAVIKIYLGSPISYSMTTSPGVAIANQGSITLTFNIQTGITIPTGGYIQILIPPGFTFGLVNRKNIKYWHSFFSISFDLSDLGKKFKFLEKFAFMLHNW